MNNLIENTYVSHFVWGCIKNKIYKNLKYIILPIIYLSILIINNHEEILINTINYQVSDTYTTVAYITDEMKLDTILEKYNLTQNQFNVLCGVVLSEAEYNSYEDAYAVINTIYNRTHSINWVKSVNNHFGNDKGYSLYYQAISPNQFTVYQSGAYKKHMNDKNSEGYKAIIDFLYTENIMHNYLSFRSHSIKVKNSESFSDKGNNYFNVMKEENRI